jgi:hypothetical protein
MSRHNHKRHYSHSSLLVLAIVVSSSLSLIFFLSNDIYAQNETSNEDNLTLIMTTDKTIYSPGETVNFTMTNTGEEQLTFPNSALGLMIRNLATNESYPIYSAQVITTLNPNESSSVIWDTVASNGNPVPPGDYIASLSSESSPTNVIFSIS